MLRPVQKKEKFQICQSCEYLFYEQRMPECKCTELKQLFES